MKTPTILIKFIIVVLVILSSQFSEGRNYYFYSSIGDDSRTSLQAQNPATPWKTITKLNSISSSLSPGDSILFKSGDVFAGTITPTISGTLSSPIIISSYGSGVKPIISGFTTLTGWTNEGSEIYSKAITVQTTPNMVTVNGVNTPLGRYPNTGYLTISSPVNNTSFVGSTLNSAVTNWTGAEVVVRKNHWVLDRGTITNHSGSTLTYTGTSGYPGLSGYGFFIQQDTKCLDVMGEWAFKSGKLYMYFGANNPNDYVVKVSVIDKLVNISSKNYITINGLELQGANNAAICLTTANNITISNCDIKYSGFDGIRTTSSDYTSVSYCTIDQTQNNSFDADTYGGSGDHTYFGHNTVTNSGMIAGMSGNGDGKAFAASVQTDNSTIEYNTLENLGYIGIIFEGNGSVVRNNYVSNFCLVRDDGAGIYTYKYTALPAITGQRTVSDNIVSNGVGAGAGTADGSSRAMGIYMDGYTEKVDILRNTVSGCNAAGLFFYIYANNITITGNTFYDNAIQIAVSRTGSYGNLAFSNNILASKQLGQRLLTVSSNGSLNFNVVGTWSGNYYINQFTDDAVVVTDYYDGSYITKPYNFDMWKAGFDATAHDKLITIPPYTINSLGSNKFSNGPFNSSITGYGVYNGPASSAWNASGGLDAGVAKITVSGTGVINTRCTAIGAIDNTKKYIARWSSLGTTNGLINVHLRQSASPYAYSTPIQYYSIKSNRIDHEILLQPKINDATAWWYFVLMGENGSSIFDNIQLYESDVTISNPNDYIRFEYNTTNSDKIIVLDGTYFDVDGTSYSGSFVLHPYASKILLKSSATSSNRIPSIKNQNFQLNENKQNNTVVGTIVATDPDAGQTLSYSILSGNTSGAFEINASTGALTIANSPALNFEVTPSFALVVKVQDNGTGNLSSQATITVSLIDINEVPIIDNQAFSVAKNVSSGTTVGTIIATDPDAGQTLIFSILSGNLNGTFVINALTGELSVANGTAFNNDFTLVVKVKDNGAGYLSSQATITINILSTGIEVNEISQKIKVYPNPVVDELTIDIKENTDNTRFEILNSLGQIVFKGKLSEKTVVQMTNFAPEVYLIKIDNRKSIKFMKVVKVNI